MQICKPCPIMKNFMTLSYVLLMLLQLFLCPCYAIIFRMPLHRAFGKETNENSDSSTKRERRSEESVTQRMEGISGEGYFINISVGTPPQQMQILIDTGSSNFALAASPDSHITHYFNTTLSSTYEESINEIHVPYTQGQWDGKLGTDVVTLTSLPNISLHPNIAFIYKSIGFFIPESNWQGIVGLAYQSIARPDSLTPFWDSVRDEAKIRDVFSMQLCGTAHSHNASADPAMEGNLVLGGVSEDLYKGDIFYSPIVKEMYYEVVISDVAVDGVSLNLDCKEYNFDKTIVDSGTTHLRLPTRVYNEVVGSIKSVLLKMEQLITVPASTFWSGEDLLCWDDLTLAFDVFPVVSLSLVSSEAHNQYFTLHLTSQHYLRSVEDVRVGFFSSTRTCLKFGISPSDSGTVLGALLMESFFVIFDRENKRMGFAQTTCPPPYSGSNSTQLIDGIHTVKGEKNLTACQYQRAIQDDSMLLIVTYIMAAICLVCALPLIIVFTQWQIRRCSDKRSGTQDPEAETVLTDGR